MPLAQLITLMIILFLVAWLVGSFFLWLALKMIGIEEERMTFGSVMITSLLSALVTSFIPLIGCIIAWWIIKERHTDTWGKAIAAWILWLVIPLIIVFVVVFIMGLGAALMPGPGT